MTFYFVLTQFKLHSPKIYTYKGNLLVADTFINVLKEKGGITKYKYGNNKKLKRVTSKYKGVFGFEEDTIYYDQNGRKIKEKDNNYKYNEKGELIEYSTMFGDHKLTEKYTYTDQGKETIYLTDDTIKNKRKFVNKDDELVYQYYYNPRNGELELSITQTFDSQGNVIENKYERKGKEPEITTYEYTYDLYGNITSKKVNGKIEGRFRYTYYQPVKKSK